MAEKEENDEAEEDDEDLNMLDADDEGVRLIDDDLTITPSLDEDVKCARLLRYRTCLRQDRSLALSLVSSGSNTLVTTDGLLRSAIVSERSPFFTSASPHRVGDDLRWDLGDSRGTAFTILPVPGDGRSGRPAGLPAMTNDEEDGR